MQRSVPAAGAAEAVLSGGPLPAVVNRAFSAGYRTYVLVILTLVYVVNYLDRQILGILVPQIKAEFHLTNTEIGVLTGPAFAVVYAVLGMPLAIFADRMNRRNMIVISLAAFSAMTVICGYTVRYWQLLFARFGTGIGEAGTSPSINSVLSDLYPPEKRASALAFYSAGLNVGLLLGFFGGGWIAEHYGWRHAFLAAGFPGLALVFVLLATVREPVRGAVERIADTGRAPGFLAVVAFLWSQPSFRWIALGSAMGAFGGYAGLAFIPLFLKISHRMTPTETGVALALLTGFGGAFGTYLAGVFADRLARRDIRWSMYVPIIAACIAIPFIPVFYLASSTIVALVAAIVPAIMGAAYLGPSYAITQSLVPLRMRAQAAAILLFVLNIIALSLGPLTVGKVSDLLQPIFGADSLRYALLTSMITASLSAVCYWRASRTVKADIARVFAETGG
jgi:predicted MFS family arabinose efflux permease